MRTEEAQFAPMRQILPSSLFRWLSALGLCVCGLAAAAPLPPLPAPADIPFLEPDLGREFLRLQREEGDAAALRYLLEQEAQHSDDVAYNYQLGVLALRSGQYGIALNAFERVVLQRPEHAGAWLDLAIASFHLGDEAAAEQFFHYVQRTFAPPPAVRKVIDQYLRQIAAHVAAKRNWQGQIGLSLGWTDNVNSGPALEKVQLTSGGQRIEVALDSRQRPRAASFLQTEALFRWGPAALQSPPDGGNAPATGLQFILHGQQRLNTGETEFNQGAALAAANYNWQRGADGWSLVLAHQDYHLGNSRMYSADWGDLTLRHDFGPCLVSGGLEVERRRYGEQTSLDGNIRSLRLGGDCMLGHPDRVASVVLRSGKDVPVLQRAGGEQYRHEILASYRHPAGAGRLEYTGRLTRQEDREGYSPLLEEGAIRHIRRGQLGILFALPVAGTQEWFVSGQYYTQQSNLKLFTQNAATLQTGWRWFF